jgi:hypothetical protein
MDVSPPLASLQPANYNFESSLGNDRAAKPIPKRSGAPATGAPSSPAAPAIAAPTLGLNFDGIGQGFGTYVVCCAPPDTNASVGPNHIVETVNLDFVVFNKSGATLYGPVPLNTVWSGFGGGCQIDNDGDPSILYDPMADRWLISQFAVTTTKYLNCVAVSTTPDPTGSWYRYSYSYADFPDYPKFGVWPDAYYVTFNLFRGGTTFSGGATCSYDRAKMLTGAAATQQCFNVGTTYGGLLPSTHNGATAPPAGTPNFVMALDAPTTSTLLKYWKFHVDWTTPASTTFTGPFNLTVASYTNSCAALARGDCIPQGSGGANLESLADRLMYRLNYRNFGDHAALVVNHTIEVGSGSALHSGVRWYEIRPDAANNLTLFQQGTYAPDSNWRWMGSVNMDKSGNIGMGYSVSSTSIVPQIHFTGRLSSDPAGTMSQGENVIINGGGAQTGGLARWGDYSSTAVDPVDDCTFFHANEYLKASGSFNWSTRIASFKLPSCGSPDFSLSATPSSATVTAGSPASYTVTVTPSGGFTGTVTFSASGLPSGASASFNPASVAGSGNSTMSVTTSTSTPAGSYPLTITGTSGTLSHTTSVTLVINAPPTPDYTLTAAPSSQTVSPGASTTYTVTVTPTNGFTGTVNLSLSGLPSGASGSFNPASLTSGTSTLTVNSATAAAGTYTLTITGSGTAGVPTRTTTVGFSIADYNLSISPSSSSVSAGSSTTYTVTVNRLGGFSGSVSFNVSALPSGASATFNPTSTTGNSATLTIATTTSTATGSYPFTVTGTSGTTSRTATATLVVTAAPVGDFSLSANPSSRSIKQGTNTSYVINVTPSGGFTGSVAFTVSGLPTGATATFSPTSSTASSTMSVTTVNSVAIGTYSLVVTGKSGTLSHTVTVTLVITQGCFGGDGDC